MILLMLFCSIISSILYRAGGLGQDEKYWIPLWMRHSWVRDWLCPFFCLLPMFLQHPSWLFILSYGAMGGAFTTYWKYKGKANYWLSGFMVGLTIIPLILCGFLLWKILLRAIILAVLWGGWCKIFGNDHVQEHGRGFFSAIVDFLL